jgi:hypothetical protein
MNGRPRFSDLDRRGDPDRLDHSKAPIVMELLKKQLLCPGYIQRSAHVLSVIGKANGKSFIIETLVRKLGCSITNLTY